MINALRKFVEFKPRSYDLTVPRIEENEGLLLLGDTGTGKSQAIHQLVRQRRQAKTTGGSRRLRSGGRVH
jgi:GTP-binding protein EngB required for normal cell division